MRFTLASCVFLSHFALAGCEDSRSPDDATSESADQQVASSELYSLTYDFRLWDLLQEQGIANDAINSHVANSIMRHLLILRAAEYEITDLKGTPLEALCRATTDEAHAIIEEHGHEDLRAIALNYIDEVQPEVISEVRRIQQSMLSQGCFLSPRSEW